MWQTWRKRTAAIPQLRLEAAPLAFVGQIGAIVAKDLRAELRTKEMASSTVVFAILVLVIFNFAFELRVENMAALAPGVLWVAITFAGVLGLGRSLAQEKDRGCLDGLLLCPVDRGVLYLGKLLAGLIFTGAMEAAVLPVFAVFFNLPLFSPALLLVVALGTVGFVAVGTLFSAVAVHTKHREIMLPLLLFPIVVPVVIAAVKATGLALMGQPWASLAPWLGLLVAFDTVFLVVCLLLFEYAVEEVGG